MQRQKFNRRRVLSLRNRIFEKLRLYEEQPIVGDVLREFTDSALEVLPNNVTRNAVFESVRAFAGQKLRRPDLLKFAWRLAGNVPMLVDGLPVLPWAARPITEIVPVCIERVRSSRQKNVYGYLFYCRVLAGSPAAEIIPQFFSSNSCRAIARLIGFSANSWGPYQYAGLGLHFANLLCFAHLDAELRRDTPAFRKVSISSGMLTFNKELIAVRCRAKPCPKNYLHPCATCFVGYDECAFAVHPKTYTEGYCRACNTDSLFDPAEPSILCVQCSKADKQDVVV